MKPGVAVIGSRGRMGALFCAEWGKNREVRGVDRVAETPGKPVLRREDVAHAVAGCGIVMLCVPAPAVPDVLDLTVPHMRGDQILADICSVKMLPMRAMQDKFRGPVVGTHPLFGPANSRLGARVAIVPGEHATDAHCEAVADLFREMGCTIFTATAEEHDKAVAVSQSLHFALSAAYFATIKRHEDLGPYLTPSFKRYMNAARKELTVNSAMFCEFTTTNPAFPETMAKMREVLKNATNGGLSALAMEAQAWYASHDSEK